MTEVRDEADRLLAGMLEHLPADTPRRGQYMDVLDSIALSFAQMLHGSIGPPPLSESGLAPTRCRCGRSASFITPLGPLCEDCAQ